MKLRDILRWTRPLGSLRWSGVLVLAAALLVMAGVFGNLPLLRQWLPSSSAMMLNSAVALAVGGAALLALDLGWSRLAGALAASITVYCLVTQVLFVFGYSIGFDEYLAQHRWLIHIGSEGGIPPNTVMAIMLVGGIIWALARGMHAQWLMLGSCGIVATFALMPLLSLATSLVGGTPYNGMALPTIVCLLVLDGALLRKIRANSPAGMTSLPFMTAAVGMLLSVGLVAVQSNRALVAINRQVVESHDICRSLDHLIASVARMESTARGFALNGVDSYRERIDVHYLSTQRELDRVQPLLADRPVQINRLKQLREIVRQKYDYNREMVRMRLQSGVTAAAAAMTSQPTEVTSALVNLADTMVEEEDGRLAQREHERMLVESNARTLQFLGAALALVLLLVALYLTRQAERARGAAEQSLKLANENLERRVEERARSLRFLADAMPQLVWTLRPDGTSENYNQGWRDYTGLTDEQSRNRGWQQVLHPDDLSAIQSGGPAMMARGQEYGGEYRLRRASDGAWRWHLWRARPERDATGQIVRWVGTSTDIHETKIQHELLEQRVSERTAELDSVSRLQRAVLDNSPLVILASAVSGPITICNRAARQLLGYSSEEILGRMTSQSFVSPVEIAERARELSVELGREVKPGREVFTALADLGRTDEHEWNMLCKDGTGIPMRAWITAMRNERNETTGYLCIAQDIRASRAAEAARDELITRFNKLGAQVPGILFQFRLRPDDTSCYPYASEGIRQLYRLAPEDIRESTDKVRALAHPDDLPEVMRTIRESARTLQPWQHEYRVRYADGTERWLLGNAKPEREADGSVLWHGYISDITERKAVEGQIKLSQLRLNEAQRLAQMGNWELDVSHRERDWWSDELYRIFGLEPDPDGVSAEQFYGLVHPADAPRVRAAMDAAIAGRQEYKTEYRIIRRDDGTVRHVRDEAERILDASGRICLLRGVVQDITVRRQAEERLRRQNQALVELTHSRSHQDASRRESFRRLTATLSRTLQVERASIWLLTEAGLECQGLFVATGANFSTGLVLAAKDYPAYFRAVAEERVIAAHDALTDPRTVEFAEGYLRPLGITSMLDVSVHLEGRLAGVVCIEHCGPARQWELDEQGFAGSVADLVQVELEAESRRQAESRLQESEERVRLATAAAELGVWEWDLPSNRIIWDEQMGQIYGLAPADYQSMTEEAWRRCLVEGAAGSTGSLLQHALSGAGRIVREFRIHHQGNRQIRHIQAVETVVKDARGEPVRVVGVNRDITAIKQAEAAVRASTAELERQKFALDQHADVAVTDATGRIIYANDRFCSTSQYTREELLGQTHRTLNSGFHSPEFFRDLYDTIGRGAVWHGEIRNRAKDGSFYWSDSTIVPVAGADGSPSHFIAIRTDITARKQLEENLAQARDQALEASRLKSEFLASVSHEIRTPMNGIIGMSGLLMDTALDFDQQEMGRVIQSSAESLLTIINDVLDYSKIEAGKMRVELTEFELQPLVEETLVLLAPRAHEKDLELVCEIDPRLHVALRGDAGRIRQVIMNLVGNAIKFTPAGEIVVRVSWEREQNQRIGLRLEVADTGIGIVAAAQPHLFQPFVQADGSTTRRYGGTGLGLAISRQLIDLMGGSIGFASEEGRGSTFWVQLELKRGSGRPAGLEPLAGEMRVLVVDDNAAARRALLAQLSEFGVRADAVDGAAEALVRLRTAVELDSPYQLALLDCHLPETDGLGLALAIRAEPALAATRLVLLSAAGSLRDPLNTDVVHFEALLTKPVRAAQLHRTLQRALHPQDRAPAESAQPRPSGAPFTQSGLRLLVAEDNPTNQLVARRLLEKLGLQADFASDGAAALRMLARNAYDVVLMDCQMPGMDGYTATRQIRAGGVARLNPRVPIIALTAYAMASDRLKCIEAGMDDYLAKPLRLEELQQAFVRNGLAVSLPVNEKADSASVPEEVVMSAQIDQLRDLPGRKHPTLLQDLVEIFLQETPATLDQLRKLAANQEAATAQLAHRLAGSGANLGGMKMREAALAVEQAALGGQWQELPERLTTLEDEWQRFQSALRRLEKPPAP